MKYSIVIETTCILLAALVLQACQPNSMSDHSLEPSPGPAISKQAAMGLSSLAFAHGQVMPKQFTADGQDHSPPLTWANVPAGTQSFVLIMDDPSVKDSSPWVHWVIYGIPGTMNGLNEGIPNSPSTTFGAMQGTDSWGTIGYRGPSPPPGKSHQYRFRLYAIDGMPNMMSGMTAQQVMNLLKDHVLATAELTAIYGRQVQAK